MSGQTTGGYVNTTNLLVPANAQTHCVVTDFVASGEGESISFQQFSLDNFTFNPQGAYFDNTAGGADLVVNIVGLNFKLVIPAGAISASNFPSPASAQFLITGSGPVKIFWVDYPLTIQPPGGVSQSVTIAGQPVAVQVAGGTIGVAGNSPVDRSIESTTADASEVLLAANPERKSLLIQAPQTAGVWLNFAGGTAGPGLSGCIFLPSGSIYESSITVNQNAINYYCATADLLICVLEG